MPERLHLVRVPFRVDALVRLARMRGVSVRNLDEGYFAHSILREIWQEIAPAPFLLRGGGNALQAWGYSIADHEQLRERAARAEPHLIGALDGGPSAVESKAIPSFAAGKRIGFLVRVCPIVRLSNGRGGKKGREVDAFLARCWASGDDQVVSREATYSEWFADRVTPQRSGFRVERVSVDAFQRERFVRRTQRGSDGVRRGKTIERPDVRLSGELVVENPDLFAETLGRGIGRHKAFGFGMLLLARPGESWEPPGGGEAPTKWS